MTDPIHPSPEIVEVVQADRDAAKAHLYLLASNSHVGLLAELLARHRLAHSAGSVPREPTADREEAVFRSGYNAGFHADGDHNPSSAWDAYCSRRPLDAAPTLPAQPADAGANAPPLAIRRVDQTVVGIGNPRANCFQACLAMISGLPLEECVDITDPAIPEDDWISSVEAWAAGRGWIFRTGIKPPQKRPYICNGPTSERQGIHAVVAVDGALFHDPHPSCAGLASWNWLGWLEPALSRQSAPDGEAGEVVAKLRAIDEASMYDQPATTHATCQQAAALPSRPTTGADNA